MELNSKKYKIIMKISLKNVNYLQCPCEVKKDNKLFKKEKVYTNKLSVL